MSPDELSHYHFSISLRIRHPDADPIRITNALSVTPQHAWKAGEPRQTPTGSPLRGVNRETYWSAVVRAGRHPDSDINVGISDVLDRLMKFSEFLHVVRSEGGSTELFIGWCFECQSGDVLTHVTLAKAAALKIDLSLDVYPPTQPQNEYTVGDGVLPP